VEAEENLACDHHELRDSIEVMGFSQPPLTASERYNKGALPEELKPVPMKAACTSNSLENLPIGHFN